jgi:UCH-binding domain
MYADLFDQLGRSRNAAANATVETPPIVAFKAGIMKLERSQLYPVTVDDLHSNNDHFTCTPDTATRGQVRLIRSPTNADEIKWQLCDRRRDTVVETEIIVPGTTFTKVERPNANAKKTNDRIYVWTRPACTPMYKMYWLQDADDAEDDDIVKTVNETLQSAKVIVTTTTSSAGTRSSSRSTGGAGGTTAGGAATTNADPQVDTLSSILENLGMPAPAATGPSLTGSGGSATTNQLTLADLQGAMASIQQQQQEHQAQQQVDLTDIITTEAITDLLDHHEAAVQRLLPFLPESQQTIEHLRDNLLSPSVRRSLALLSQALQDSGDSYGSVIANFQLDANAGQDALVRGNPIAAFLDCVTASVAAAAAQQEEAGGGEQQQEEKEEAAEGDESKDEESKEDDAAVDES